MTHQLLCIITDLRRKTTDPELSRVLDALEEAVRGISDMRDYVNDDGIQEPSGMGKHDLLHRIYRAL